MRSANSVIVDVEHPVASGTRDPAPAAQRARLHKAKALLARRAARGARNGAAAIVTGNQLRRAVGAMRHVLETSYRDSLFERPDLIEDDYYRFRNQPYGW
jgi:hypothetical protein